MNVITNPTALILGATGQDGSLLSELLSRKGYRVIGLSRNVGTYIPSRHRYLSLETVHFEQVKSVDLGRLNDIFKKYLPDEVYVLSAQGSVGQSFDYPIETFESITTSTIAVCEAAIKQLNPPKVFFASSSEIFRADCGPISLRTEVNPSSPYGLSRCLANDIVRYYSSYYDLRIVIGHMFNHESELRSSKYVTRKLALAAYRAKTSHEKTIMGNLDVIRDWGDAREFVEAMWLSLQRDHATASEYIICTGQGHSLRDIASRMFEYYGLNYAEYINTSDLYCRPNESPSIIGDPKQTDIELGWKHNLDFGSFITNLMTRTERSADLDW